MSEGTNPWLAPGTPKADNRADTAETRPEASEPRSAAAAVRGIRSSAGRPVAATQSRPLCPLWWLGVHGRAGETTLAPLVPWSAAVDHSWPELDTPESSVSAKVVLVARARPVFGPRGWRRPSGLPA